MAPPAVIDLQVLTSLVVVFASVSLAAIGGINVVLPEIHRQVVDVLQIVSNREFADLFAFSQVAPGPNFLFVAIVGYRAAGLAGALVALTALLLPTGLLMYAAGKVWDRFGRARWRVALEAGLAPLTAGLLGASALVLARSADPGAVATALTLATAFVATFTRRNPLLVFAAAAVLGMLGLV